ncbi:MAG: aminoglycoside phosphotransferase family protein [Planctomycetota bacterium]
MLLTRQELGQILSQKYRDPSLSIVHTHLSPVSVGARNQLYRCKVRYQGKEQKGSDTLILKVYQSQVIDRHNQPVNSIALEGKILEIFNRVHLPMVPKLYLLDYKRHLAVMEDISSSTSAESLAQESLKNQLKFYQKILKALARIHQEGNKRLNFLNFHSSKATDWYQLSFISKTIQEDPYGRALYSTSELQDLEHLIKETIPLLARMRLGFIHGDLNPNNILMNASGEPVFVDWELARLGHTPVDMLDFLNRHPHKALEASYKKDLLHYYLLALKTKQPLQSDITDNEKLFDTYNLLSNFMTVVLKTRGILQIKIEAKTMEEVHQAIRFEEQVLHALENIEQRVCDDPLLGNLYALVIPFLHMLATLTQKAEFKKIKVEFRKDTVRLFPKN